MIEIPPTFAGRPAVNPESQGEPTVIAKTWRGAQGLAEDVRHYGQWMRGEAEKRIGHLYPPVEVPSVLGRERPDLKPYQGRRLTVIAWLWARTVKSPNPAFRRRGCPARVHVHAVDEEGQGGVRGAGDRGPGDSDSTVKVGPPLDEDAANGGDQAVARGELPVPDVRCSPITGTTTSRSRAEPSGWDAGTADGGRGCRRRSDRRVYLGADCRNTEADRTGKRFLSGNLMRRCSGPYLTGWQRPCDAGTG